MLEKAPEVIGALETVAEFLDKMGVPGLLTLFMIGPAMIVAALFALDYLRQRHAKQDAEERRKESEAYRAQLLEMQSQHQTEMQKFARDMSTKHAEVSQFYKDNVELVKTTQRLATDMRDIITNNTRALEHLTSVAQANFFCPVAREKATGKK
ncbi:MAG: hypothetical protein DELT_02535 [Desulfovibrio sp.]